MNYALHLALRFVGRLTGSIPLEDVFIVGLLETVVIATGWIVIRTHTVSKPVRTAGVFLFSGNALFLSLLFFQLFANGFEQLNALIRL